MADERIMSRPVSKIYGCEACIYRRGPHAEWCPVGQRRTFMDMPVTIDPNCPSGVILLLDRDGNVTGEIFNVGLDAPPSDEGC